MPRAAHNPQPQFEANRDLIHKHKRYSHHHWLLMLPMVSITILILSGCSTGDAAYSRADQNKPLGFGNSTQTTQQPASQNHDAHSNIANTTHDEPDSEHVDSTTAPSIYPTDYPVTIISRSEIPKQVPEQSTPTATDAEVLDVLVHQAFDALMAGDANKAVQYLTEAQTIEYWAQSESAPSILFWLGQSFERLEERVAAISAYQRILTLYPNSSWADRARKRLTSLTYK